MENTERKPKWIGFLNGEAYPVYKRHNENETIGLTEIEGWSVMVWCTFERIEDANVLRLAAVWEFEKLSYQLTAKDKYGTKS